MSVLFVTAIVDFGAVVLLQLCCCSCIAVVVVVVVGADVAVVDATCVVVSGVAAAIFAFVPLIEHCCRGCKCFYTQSHTAVINVAVITVAAVAAVVAVVTSCCCCCCY